MRVLAAVLVLVLGGLVGWGAATVIGDRVAAWRGQAQAGVVTAELDVAQEAHRGGDCATALAGYRRARDLGGPDTGGQELVAREEECSRFLEAAQARRDGNPAGAAAIYELLLAAPGNLLDGEMVRAELGAARRELVAGREAAAAEVVARAEDVLRRLREGAVVDPAELSGTVTDLATLAGQGATTVAPRVPQLLNDLFDPAVASLAAARLDCEALALTEDYDGYRNVAPALAASADKARERIPQALLNCARLRLEEGAVQEADGLLARLRGEYAGHPLTDPSNAELIGTEIATIQALGSSPVPAPIVDPADGAQPGQARLEIVNGSDRPVLVRLLGPVARLAAIAGGEGCEDPAAPRAVLDLPPGLYQVVVEDPAAAPGLNLAGPWTLTPDTALRACPVVP